MLKKRLIPVLLVSEGRLVKTVQFSNPKETGTPLSQAKIYNAHSCDELVVLDIDPGSSDIYSIISEMSEECFMPLSVGGGIHSIEQIKKLLRSGADKVVINTKAINCPSFIKEASDIFGRQCIVVSIDIKKIDGDYRIVTNSASKVYKQPIKDVVLKLAEYGAGEFLFTSVDNEGVMKGYNMEMIELVKSINISRPILINGGAGNYGDLLEVYSNGADGACCASIFHFGDNSPLRARSYLINNQVKMKRIK